MLTVAARYANSLFSKAKENNQIDKVLEDLLLFVNLLENNKQISDVWNSLSISYSDKEKLLSFLPSISNITKNFLKLILIKKRQKLLPKILYYYKSIYNRYNKIIEVNLKVSFDLEKSEIENLIKNLENSLKIKIKIKNIIIDKEIIGGIVIISEDNIIDLSVKKDLEKILKKFEETVNNKITSIKIT